MDNYIIKSLSPCPRLLPRAAIFSSTLKIEGLSFHCIVISINIVVLIISLNEAMDQMRIKNSHYIVHYKMLQYKYSASLLNHD